MPQGSKTIAKRGGKVWMRDANAARLKPWRAIVAEAADIGVTFDQPVIVWLSFTVRRPIRPRFLAPAVKPDVDKLTRSTLDGLKDGGLIADDARVVLAIARKRYPDHSEPLGAHITVEPWTQQREDSLWLTATHP